MRYIKHTLIARGGMGDVYSGVADNGMKVALKQVNSNVASNPKMLDLFIKEAEALAKLNSPSVVRILERPFGDRNGNYYLPMEFVDGETLTNYIKRRGPLSEDHAKIVMAKILNAVEYIHSHKLVHRDIKPSNIMLRPDESICIIDFGIAKDLKMNSGSSIGQVLGTDGYMSPEQAGGLDVDYRTDIYSLGCVLFFLVTGTHAFFSSNDSIKTRYSIINDAFPRPQERVSSISDSLQSIILTAVDKNMLNRFQSISSFRDALIGVGQTIVGSSPVFPSRDAIVTVGRSGTDVIVPGLYVSSYHLDIVYSSGSIVITDHSKNGTSVLGRKLSSGDSFSFSYSPGARVKFPSVYLAGRCDCELPWDVVMKIINEIIKDKVYVSQ